MPQPQEMTGIQTKEKANQIARQIRQLRPDWTVEVIGGAPPYTVRATPPADALRAPEAPSPGAPSAAEVSGIGASSRPGALGFLDFIAQYESNGNYNARYGDATNTNAPHFTSMSVEQVLAWQQGRKFSACGKFQIIRATLAGLVQTLGLRGDELYDPSLQDRMAIQLLKERGLEAFLNGTMAREDFALNVAREWAALPGVKAPYGERSVYAGDGVNQALVATANYLSAVDLLKATA